MMNEIETFTMMALAWEIRKAMKKKDTTHQQTQSDTSHLHAHFSLTYFASSSFSLCSFIFFFSLLFYSFLRFQQLRFQTITLDLELHYEIVSVVAICFDVFGRFTSWKITHMWITQTTIHSGYIWDCEMMRIPIHQQKQLECEWMDAYKENAHKYTQKVNEPGIKCSFD